jgi:hypothetical protein
LFEDSGGKFTTKIITRGGQQIRRPEGTPTPCAMCPKKSPKEAHNYELTTRNIKAVQFYRITQAMHGRNIVGRMRRDTVMQRVLATIDVIMKQHERREMAEGIGTAIMPFIPLGLMGAKR